MKINSKNFIFYLFLPILLVSAVNNETSHASKRYMIKFATVAPEGSTWVKCMRELDKRLRSESNGKIGFRIYAGGIAGDELDVLKKIRIGQLHCSAFSGVGISEILPIWRVLDLPFLFRNRQEINEVHDDLKNLFVDEFRKTGFEYLSWAEVGDVHLFSKKEIKVRNDLKGLKIWTWSGDPVSKKTFTVMGSTPIPLSITDVTTAINTNMIDTVYAPPIGALAMQWHAGMKYMTGLPITHSTGAILISGSYFDKIPRELSDLLKREVKYSMEKLANELYDQSEESIKIIKDRGLTVFPIPVNEELEKFYEIHREVSEELKGIVYPEKLLERVRSILKSIRNNQ
jgi:TRAP-type C4-dicarboxylate transport system substrate-binding protein